MHLSKECQNWRVHDQLHATHKGTKKIWRRAKIIAILKKGKNPDEAASYRPISLPSIGYTLLERLIYNRLLPLVDPQLPREQAGLRPRRSTLEQVVKLTEDIEAAFETGKKCEAVFVDQPAQKSNPENAPPDTQQSHGPVCTRT